MAIGLNDLKKGKKKKVADSSEISVEKETTKAPKKVTRPWQIDEDFLTPAVSGKTHALRAIEKARRITEKNDQFCRQLKEQARERFPETCSEMKIQSITEEEKKRIDHFEKAFSAETILVMDLQDRKKKTLIGRIVGHFF